MEENLKDRTEEDKLPRSAPSLKPGGSGITINPVSPPAFQSTTPLPKVAVPPPFTFTSPPKAMPKEKREIASLLLLLMVILNVFSLWLLLTIAIDKIPGFLAKLF